MVVGSLGVWLVAKEENGYRKRVAVKDLYTTTHTHVHTGQKSRPERSKKKKNKKIIRELQRQRGMYGSCIGVWCKCLCVIVNVWNSSTTKI